MYINKHELGILILRLSMAAVYLYFGFSQFFDGINWVSLVPAWAVNILHLPPAMIVMANGLMEIVLGVFLIVGLWTRWVAIILAVHLFVIAFEFGFTPLGARDFGLAFATLSLVFLGSKEEKEPIA